MLESNHMEKAYLKDISFIIQTLQTDAIYGLPTQEIAERLRKYGMNKLDEKKPPSWVIIFLSQFANPLIYILVLAAFLIFLVADDRIDAFIILGILLFNAVVGTIQEGRTRKILVSLQQFIIQETIVLREGKKQLISNTQLVPGDIVIVQAGQRIPADMRIIESHNVRVDEALLTGESGSVYKSSITYEKEVPLSDRKNMLYSGTYVLSGWAHAVVVATGMESEIGKIQKSVQEIQTDVPLVVEMQHLSWWIISFIFITCLILLSIGLFVGTPLKDLLILLIALFICVIPEGLPVVLTLVLVTGVYRMAKQKVLVKNMQAVEGLGHAQVIVIDKTGTLTRNEMIVSRVFVDGHIITISGKGYYSEGSLFLTGKHVDVKPNSDLYLLAQGLRLINSSTITFVQQRGTFDIKGDPTEAALYIAAQKVPVSEQDFKEYKKIFEIPFDSEYRYHAGFYEYQGEGIAFVAGSPEAIGLRSKKELPDDIMQQFLQDGLRLVAVAVKKFDLKTVRSSRDEQEQLIFFKKLIDTDLRPLALCGIEDSIRHEAITMIAKARKAGLHIIMATGDHQRTALAIAKQVGIYKTGDEAIDGSEFDKMNDDQLKEIIIHTTVFSRVTPDQKLRIIDALHKRGLTVAMTGDGVNDAPSLVAADIGIAMGAIGTEIAKSASDIILLDDSFVNIVNAIEEGRHIIYSIRRVILYFFSTNCAEILILLFTFLLSLFFPQISLIFPLTAAQILWLNLITDGFLDTALAMEKREYGLLYQEEWTRKKLRLIDRSIFWHMLWSAIPMAIGSLLMFLLYRPYNIDLARTMALVTLGMFQWFNAWNCRSLTLSIGQLGLLSNLWLIVATLVVAFLQLLILHVPFLQQVFGTIPLNGYQWAFAGLVACSIIVLEELRKWYIRRHS